MEDPINTIKWVEASTLQANHWNPNRVFKAEMRLLQLSLLSTGWIQPLLVNRDLLIIDGFHRWRLALDAPQVKKRWGGLVPVAILDIPEDEAMAVTVRINRAKGHHVAVEMHQLVTDLLTVHGWSRERLGKEIGAGVNEVDLLAQEGVFTARKIDKWAYSNSWYPVEAEIAPTEIVPG